MYSTSNFRRGLRVMYNGAPHEILDYHHHKPGKGAALVRTKLKTLITGFTVDPTFRSGDKLERPDLVEHEMQFLYAEQDSYNFMDPTSYEQCEINKKILGDATNFLVENLTINVLFYEGRPLSVELPNNVALEVVECDPAVRGDTVSGATKPAKFSTGYSCQVPLFITQGEKLKIDTRAGEYIERA